MEYIKPEEFLKQPKKVKEVFIKYWEPEFGDLFLDQYERDAYIDVVGCVPINKKHFESYQGKICHKENCIPLPTEGWLRKFIEDKTGKKIWVSYNPHYCEGNVIIIDLGNDFEELKVKHDCYSIVCDNLLQAYFQVACKITEEE